DCRSPEDAKKPKHLHFAPDYQNHFELGFNQPVICSKYPYMDQYYGVYSAYGPQLADHNVHVRHEYKIFTNLKLIDSRCAYVCIYSEILKPSTSLKPGDEASVQLKNYSVCCSYVACAQLKVVSGHKSDRRKHKCMSISFEHIGSLVPLDKDGEKGYINEDSTRLKIVHEVRWKIELDKFNYRCFNCSETDLKQEQLR
ncbi:hypothetical protein RJ641_025238, partial [Dillenia turbinata]